MTPKGKFKFLCIAGLATYVSYLLINKIIVVMSATDSSFRVVVNIKVNDESTSVNSYVYDENDNFISNAIIKVDGKSVEIRDNLPLYATHFYNLWNEGSEHSFFIQTPDGYSEFGTINQPLGTLDGVKYEKYTTKGNPLSYSISHVGGDWPEGTVIHRYSIIKDPKYWSTKGTSIVTIGTDYRDDLLPTGDEVLELEGYMKGTKRFKFEKALRSVVNLTTYRKGSVVTITGRAATL